MPNIARVIDRIETAQSRGSKWWHALNEEQQQEYLKHHPRSRLAREAGVKQAALPDFSTGSFPRFNDHMHSLFYGAKIDLSQVHRSHWNHIAHELTDLHYKFPQVQLSEIRSYDPEKEFDNIGDSKISAWARGGNGRLFFNNKYYAVPFNFRLEQSLKESTAATIKYAKLVSPRNIKYQRDEDGHVKRDKNGNPTIDHEYFELGFHDEMDDPRHIIRHEFGHNLHSWLIGGHGDTMFTTHMVRPEGFGSVHSTAYQFITHHFNDATKDKSKAISGYGLTNESEWFAETFAATKYGGPATQKKPAIKYFKNFLNIVADPKKHKPLVWSDEPGFSRELKYKHVDEMYDMHKKMGLPTQDWMHPDYRRENSAIDSGR